MTIRFAHRPVAAATIAIMVAAAVWLVDGRVDGALVALVGAVAVALAAVGTRKPGAPPSAATEADGTTMVREVLDVILEPVLLVRDGVVTFANGAARRLLGRHVVGEDVRVAIRHPAAAERLMRDDATDRPVELVGLGSPDQRWEMRTGKAADGGRIVHLVDRTGNYAAERMRVDFVANASHELRTPLASILGYVETLTDETGDDPAIRRRFLSVMFDEARRMQRLVEDLISLSRIEAEKYRQPGETIDLGNLIGDVRAEFGHGAHVGTAEIITMIDTDVPAVMGDRAQLSQLLHNLIGNAVKYGRSGGRVTVALTAGDAATIRLIVTDEGEGIASEHIPRLTERFYRVDAGRSRALGGTGLGLAIVKHIVERHRGRFDIASKVGIGTTATVTLPAATAVTKA